MITRPSVAELTTGLIRNFEKLAQQQGAGVQQLMVPALAVLDRVQQEWPSWQALLCADNADLRATLTELAVVALPPEQPAAAVASHLAGSAVAALEEENRALKQALVDAIHVLDLPADAHSSTAAQAADAAVLALLQRMLWREASVPVPAPRSAATGGNPVNAGVALDALQRVLESFLADRLPHAQRLEIAELQPLAGGASREAWTFAVSWSDDLGQHHESCILMREPVASVLVSDSAADVIDGTRRTVAAEVRVLQAMQSAGLKVPVVLWFDVTGDWLERPFSIMRRLPGTADVSALLEGERSSAVMEQFVAHLAQLHAQDPRALGLEFLGQPQADEAALAQVLQFEKNFHAQCMEPFPATTYLIAWLKKHAPIASRVRVVHGDYRLGNFLYDADQIIAILDWEQVHIGDPVEEIAFMYWAVWTLEPLCSIESFIAQYEQASGSPVDRDTLAYYRMFIEFKMLVVLFTGLRSFYATDELQLHYGSAQTTEMIRDSQLRAIEALAQGGPTVAFDAYQKISLGVDHG